MRSCLGVQHRPPASQELTQHRASTVLPALRLGSSRVGAGRGAAKPARPQARTPAPPLLQAGLGRLAQRRAARRGEGSPSSAWPRRAHVPAAAKHCSNTTPHHSSCGTHTHMCAPSNMHHAPTNTHACTHTCSLRGTPTLPAIPRWEALLGRYTPSLWVPEPLWGRPQGSHGGAVGGGTYLCTALGQSPPCSQAAHARPLAALTHISLGLGHPIPKPCPGCWCQAVAGSLHCRGNEGRRWGWRAAGGKR